MLIATISLAEEHMLLLTVLSSRCLTDAVQEDYLRRWGQTHLDLTGRNRRIANSDNFLLSRHFVPALLRTDWFQFSAGCWLVGNINSSEGERIVY